jgi:hypothetical protein
VGIGQYNDESAGPLQTLPSGRHYMRENAHNNFLQIFAELGLVGFGLFIWISAEAVRSAARAAASQPDGRLYAGFARGMAAFLLSALVGHPLLTPDVAYTFWMMLGVLAAAQPVEARELATARRLSAIVAVMILASFPIRAAAVLRVVDLDHIGYGLSTWQIAEDGTRYRTASQTATIFVPATAALVDVPLRLGRQATEPVVVEIALEGRSADRVFVTAGEWRHYKLRLPSGARTRFVPVTLQLATGDTTPLQVGKVAVLQGAR